MTDRLSSVKIILEEYAINSSNVVKHSAHAYGVSAFAALLAARRGLDAEIAAVMGLLHDIYAIKAGTYESHDTEGAKMAEELLRGTALFSDEEIGIVSQGILLHDRRNEVHDPYDEVLKDADIIYPYFTNLPAKISPDVEQRIYGMLRDLGICLRSEDVQF